MSSQNEISSLIWSVPDDILRGLFKPHEYGDIVLPFIVLRRLDCILESRKDEVYQLWEEYRGKVEDPEPIIKGQLGVEFFNRSKYDLSRLKGDSKNIRLNFNDYLNGFSRNVYDIVDNFGLEKHIQKLDKNNRLYQLIDKFTEIDLHPDVVDNHTMGSVFEELLRRFSEMSNETSGEHYTPRDVVTLLVSLLFSESDDDLSGQGKIRTLYDCCCGTGGMLSLGKRWVLDNINSDLEINLYGQELNPVTYSVCKSDILITGENPNNIKLGSSLSQDGYPGSKFDYMITNPPFGVSWKSDQSFVNEESQSQFGRFSVGTPRVSDGSLLFLQHLISKMDEKGSRIGIVFNGSPLFTGDSGGGESEIRRWIIENDWLECIVSLPDQLFFNTGISTYVWIVTNRKSGQRKGNVQLINGSDLYSSMRKSLGNKRKEITETDRQRIRDSYVSFEESDICKIYPNEFFGYTKVTIEQPLIENGVVKTTRDGDPKPDSSKRDYERIPLTENIEEYVKREVDPHLDKYWVDRSRDSVGYEINFSKYFYEYTPPRSIEEISREILQLDSESEGLLHRIMGNVG